MNQAAAVRSAPTRDEVPLFRVLERFRECDAILARNNVGRIAFALQDRVSVVPVHYVYEDGWIYGRTTGGGKLRNILRNRRVAFEVDEHTHLFEWRSVVVRGPLYLIDQGSSVSDQRTHEKATALIRRLVPSAFTESDPVPFRDQLFRIRAVEISGRSSEPTGGIRMLPANDEPPRETAEPEADVILRQQVAGAVGRLGPTLMSDVHIDAFDGVIVLTGMAEDAAQRSEIEAAVLEVPRVRAVVQQLETRFPLDAQPTPAQIAREALGLLAAWPPVTDSGLKIIVEHGWLRLEGEVDSRNTRDEAVRRLRGVKGSRGVIDRLGIRASASLANGRDSGRNIGRNDV
jgi:nitroimidazol reductase NimA-like FMN-containing flavoprotein (pyridoxamine 5'-phosphate oxidase superfamily)